MTATLVKIDAPTGSPVGCYIAAISAPAQLSRQTPPTFGGLLPEEVAAPTQPNDRDIEGPIGDKASADIDVDCSMNTAGNTGAPVSIQSTYSASRCSRKFRRVRDQRRLDGSLAAVVW